MENLLWSETNDDVCVYALIDGSFCFELYGRLLQIDLSWAHMFQGGMALKEAAHAPYLVALERGHPFTRWLIEEGFGKGWGVFLAASTEAARARYGERKKYPLFHEPTNKERVKLSQSKGLSDPIWLIREHFRHFSMVEFESDSDVVNFRYYDPAVLRTYIPTCSNYELMRFFGCVQYFIADGFCEVESLSRPHDVSIFAASFDESVDLGELEDAYRNPPMIFEYDRYDVQTEKREEIERSPVAFEPVEREGGCGLWMIRRGQQKAFLEEQERIFQEKLKQKLLPLLHMEFKTTDHKQMDAYVNRNIEKAAAYNMANADDAFLYLACSLIHGENFHETHPVLKQEFHAFDKTRDWNMGAKLRPHVFGAV